MNFDRTFCSNPNCENACGKKMSPEEKEFLRKENFTRPISVIDYCKNETFKKDKL